MFCKTQCVRQLSRTCNASQSLLSRSRAMGRPTLLDKIEWTAQKRAGLQVSGDQTARVTPVPIPNTEVKPRRADDTAWVTVWERRSSPGLHCKGRFEKSKRPFLFCSAVPNLKNNLIQTLRAVAPRARQRLEP